MSDNKTRAPNACAPSDLLTQFTDVIKRTDALAEELGAIHALACHLCASEAQGAAELAMLTDKGQRAVNEHANALRGLRSDMWPLLVAPTPKKSTSPIAALRRLAAAVFFRPKEVV